MPLPEVAPLSLVLAGGLPPVSARHVLPVPCVRPQITTAVASFVPGCCSGYAHHCSNHLRSGVFAPKIVSRCTRQGWTSPAFGSHPHPCQRLMCPLTHASFPGSYTMPKVSFLPVHSSQS